MKGFWQRVLGATRITLIAAVIAVTGAVIASDREQASAAHTQVFYTVSTTTPSAVTNVTTMPGSGPITLNVWASNVHDAQGIGAFEVVLRYNPAFMQMGSILESTDWLDNTGRTPSCLAPVIEPVPGDPVLWRAKAVCFTITNPPPYGPLGSGKIAQFSILPGTTYGVTQLTNLTVLTDPGQVIPPNQVIDPQVIPAAEISANVRTARCGDFNNDNAISGLDFFQLLGKFGTTMGGPGWNAIYDLDVNNAVSGTDFFIELGAFGSSC